MPEASEARARPPRWDPDERGIGVGDARAHLDRLDALRAAADQEGWVAEEPEAHLLPHIVRHVGAGAPWALEATATEPDGTFVVELRWTGPAEADRRTVRIAAYALIGVIAEGITAIAESAEPRRPDVRGRDRHARRSDRVRAARPHAPLQDRRRAPPR